MLVRQSWHGLLAASAAAELQLVLAVPVGLSVHALGLQWCTKWLIAWLHQGGEPKQRFSGKECGQTSSLESLLTTSPAKCASVFMIQQTQQLSMTRLTFSRQAARKLTLYCKITRYLKEQSALLRFRHNLNVTFTFSRVHCQHS